MSAIVKNGGVSGMGPMFPSRPEFSFYEIALAAVQYRDTHIEPLGGGWYCYTALPWIFTYRVPQWTDRDVEQCRARVRKWVW